MSPEQQRIDLAVLRLRAAVNGDDYDVEFMGGSPFDDVQILLVEYDRLAARSGAVAQRPVDSGEPIAWFGEYDGHLDTTIYRDTMERWKALGRKITPLYASPPAPLQAGTWMPIETAPKDGRAFLACTGNWMTVCHWHRHQQCWATNGPAYAPYPADEQPTHWQKLPDGPSLPSTPDGSAAK